ncbi:MAG: MFS transporter [Akkermansiaceae bacterium]|nr:MFS transporter [Armatimonadota bacterium]
MIPDTPPKKHAQFALSACQFFITGTTGFLQPFLPLYILAAGLSPQRYGYAAAIGTATCLLIQPLLGKLSDKIDARRPVMIGAAIVAGLAYAAFRYAPTGNFVLLTLLLALGANGFQYLNAATGVLASRLAATTGEAAGSAYVRTRVWGSVGYIVIALIAGLLVRGGTMTAKPSRDALDAVFLWGPFLFVLVAVIAGVVPDGKSTPVAPTPSPSPAPQERGVADKSGTNVPSTGVATSPQAPLSCGAGEGLGVGASKRAQQTTNRRRFLLSFLLYQISLYGASAYLSLFLSELNAAPTWLTATFAAGVLCEVLIMTQVGRWTDAHGRRPAMLFSFLLLPLRLLMYIPATGPLWVLLVQSLHGFNFGILGTIAVVFVNDTADPEKRGAAQAELAATLGLGNSIGPIVCGYLVERHGLGTMFGAMSVLAVVAVLLFCAFVGESHAAPNGDFVNRMPRFLRKPWLVK